LIPNHPGNRRVPSAFAAVLIVFLLAIPSARAFEISGVVVDPKGGSAPNANVWISQDRCVNLVKTDTKGAFTFTNVLPRPAELVARKEGFGLGGIVVSVIGSGSVKIGLCDPDVVKLKIKDEAGEPLPGAFVRAMFVADSFNVSVEDLSEHEFPPIRSDDEGNMTLPELPKGSHLRFVLGHRDCADAQVAYLPVGGKEQTIVMYPGVKLRGRVTCDGKGVPKARVVVSKIGSGAQRDAADALTDPEGFYNVSVAPGEYFVNVRHPNFASPKAQHADVKAEADRNVLDVSLARPRVIEGSVVYPDGKPCSGIFVSYWIGSDLYGEVVTQIDGMYRLLTPLEDGAIRIIPPDGYMTENLGDIAIKGAMEPETKLSPIKLVELPYIEGVILDQDGKPAQNVLLSSTTLVPPVWFITDADGKFKIRLPQAPPEGKERFRAEHAERLLRCDFEASFTHPAPIAATLAPFEPDITQKEIKKGENDLSATMGSLAPELECDHWFNTQPITMESLRGKVVVLAFWTAFDLRGALLDCIEELRALNDLLKDDDDVKFVCIHDNGMEVEEIQKSLDACKITFPVGRDNEAFKTYQAYGVSSIPQIALVDKHGKLRFFQVQGRLLELIKTLRREG
jgi:peroxiredoxin